MNTPSIDLPQPKIDIPLSFKPVKQYKEIKAQTEYLDKILESSFLKHYFKKKK